MSDSPSDISFKTSLESIVSAFPAIHCPSKGASVRSKSLSDLNIDYPTENLSKSFHGLLKAPSFSELVSVQFPENPCIHDIYTINPGPVYHELPSLVKVEPSSKMAESKNTASNAPVCVCDESESNIYCKFCDKAKLRNLIDEDDCQFDHFLPKASDRESGRASLFIPDLKMFSEDAGIDREFIENISASERPSSQIYTSSEKPKSLLETVMNLDVSYDLGSPTKSENLGVISCDNSGASSGITSPTFDLGFEVASGENQFEENECDAASEKNENDEEFDATVLENLSPSDSVTEVGAESDSGSPSPLPDTNEELVKPAPSELQLADVKRDSENLDNVPSDVVQTDSSDDDTKIQEEDENVNPGDTPELSESWVDLSKSNPPTPPHPHLVQQQQRRCDPAPGLASRPLSATGDGSAASSSELPPAQPHVTTSHSSGPFSIPHSMDSSMLVESSFLRHAEAPMTSSSLAEQYDSVGPLGFGNGEEYLRLLKEAQKDSSNQSSAIVSLASSRRDSPRGSPKSPPNSPNTELATDGRLEQLGAVYINYYSKETDNYVRVEKNSDTDWIWDWSSRPDQLPPKVWRFSHPGSTTSSCSGGTPVGSSTIATITTPTAATTTVPSGTVRRGASLRRVKVGQSALFSRGVLYTLFITNVLSFLLGTGIGVWLSKRTGPQLSIATLPFN